MAPTASEEVFESSVRSRGDLAGVFEYDGETGYFYLYASGKEEKVLRALHVFSGPCSFAQADVEVRWAADESVVGLFISGRVWAVFDTASGAEYSGNFAAGKEPVLPERVSSALAAR
jgi:hypothetical protein